MGSIEMTWRVDYDNEIGIIRCAYADKVTADEYKEGTMKVIALATRHKTNLVLIDETHLKYAVTMGEIFDMPKYYDDFGGNRKSRLAVILPPSGKIREDVLFWVTVCRNRGWRIGSFDDHQKAIDWLLSDR